MSTLHTTLAAIVQDIASWLRWHRPRSRYARLIAELERLDAVDLQGRIARWEARAADWEAVFAAIGLRELERDRSEPSRSPRSSRPHLTLHHGGAA